MSEPVSLTLVLPFFNEAGFIGHTLASLARQTCNDFRVIAVNNGSTDGGEAEARSVAAANPRLVVDFLHEPKPGKIHALCAGTRAASSRLVGTIDADTIYPPEYVERCLAMFAGKPDAAGVMAFFAEPGAGPSRSLALQSRIFTRKCHTGGFGQTFSRQALEAAGGFDADRWGYVLEDHEIVHQVSRFGRLVYDSGHVCFPSDRRADRSRCNWTLFERITYKLLPLAAMDWFFYRFLARRFDARGLANVRLREQQWNAGATS